MQLLNFRIVAVISVFLTVGWSVPANGSDLIRLDESPRPMFSIKKSFGGSQKSHEQSQLTFSLSFEVPSTHLSRDPTLGVIRQSALPLIGWQFDTTGRHGFNALGGLNLDSSSSRDPDSSFGPNWWKWALGGVAVAGALCALETLICEDDDSVSPGL